MHLPSLKTVGVQFITVLAAICLLAACEQEELSTLEGVVTVALMPGGITESGTMEMQSTLRINADGQNYALVVGPDTELVGVERGEQSVIYQLGGTYRADGVLQGDTLEVRRLELLSAPPQISPDQRMAEELRSAVIFKGYDEVKSLLDAGADPNRIEKGEPPLHLAIRFADRDIVELLLNRGADVNGRSDADATPLHLAIEKANHDKELIWMLLSAGADVNAINSVGNTPRRFDLRFQIDCWLLEQGQHYKVVDKVKQSPNTYCN